MTFLVLLVVFLAFFVGLPWLVRRSAARRVSTGLAARGLILRASSTATDALIAGQRFESRAVVLDVEVPGRPPYEVSLVALFPRLCEAVPGAALDLRVAPNDPQAITVVGPVGSSAWLPATAGLFPWAPARSASRGAMVVVAIISGFLAIAAALSLLGDRSPSNEEPAGPAVSPPAVAPEPSVTPSTRPMSPTCDAAERCCDVLTPGRCGSFNHVPEATCRAMLQREKQAAARQHKTCE